MSDELFLRALRLLLLVTGAINGVNAGRGPVMTDTLKVAETAAARLSLSSPATERSSSPISVIQIPITVDSRFISLSLSLSLFFFLLGLSIPFQNHI